MVKKFKNNKSNLNFVIAFIPIDKFLIPPHLVWSIITTFLANVKSAKMCYLFLHW